MFIHSTNLLIIENVPLESNFRGLYRSSGGNRKDAYSKIPLPKGTDIINHIFLFFNYFFEFFENLAVFINISQICNIVLTIVKHFHFFQASAILYYNEEILSRTHPNIQLFPFKTLPSRAAIPPPQACDPALFMVRFPRRHPPYSGYGLDFHPTSCFFVRIYPRRSPKIFSAVRPSNC